MGIVRIGISGWRYKGWRGSFYPPGLLQARELETASRHVDTIEINGSHYSLQTPTSYGHWHDATPEGFVFSVKAPRYLTHILRFRGEEVPAALANFFASGLFNLREKLGPILWQFPPNFSFEPDAFEKLLRLLPVDLSAAGDLAEGHDERVPQPCLTPQGQGRMRHAIEVRHASFCTLAFIELLRKYDAALVVSDSVKDWPYGEDLTSDFVYMRLHGTETLYSGAYSDAALDCWATRMKAWARGEEAPQPKRIAPALEPRSIKRDVYCYFDNDMKVQAPFDAQRLAARVELTLST